MGFILYKYTSSLTFYPKVNCDVFILHVTMLSADINLNIHPTHWGKEVFNFYLKDLEIK